MLIRYLCFITRNKKNVNSHHEYNMFGIFVVLLFSSYYYYYNEMNVKINNKRGMQQTHTQIYYLLNSNPVG